MPKLYDRQGNQWVDIQDHLVEEAYKSGRYLFRNDAEVNVRLPDGSFGTVSADKFDDVLLAGGSYDLAVDRQERIDELEYGGGTAPVEALLLAAGRGLSFGLTDVAAEKFGFYSEEDLRKLEEYNPAVSAVGEIGGVVLPAFATGGTSLAARILQKTAAGGAARAGVAAEKLTASALAKAGFAQTDAIADKLVRGGASLGAAAGVEGVLFGAGETLSEELLGRTDRTAEQIMLDIGGIGVLSGGIGAALGAGPAALTKAFQAFHGNRFSKGVGEKVAQFSDDLTAAMTSGDRATIAKFRDPEFLDRFIGFDEVRKKTDGDVKKYIEGFLSDLQNATRMASGSTKAERMRGLVNAKDPVETIQSSINSLVAIKKSLSVMLNDPVAYKAAQEKAGPLMDAVDLQLKKMGEAIQSHLRKTKQIPKGGRIVLEDGSFVLKTEKVTPGLKSIVEEVTTPLGDLPEMDRLARAADAERRFAKEGDDLARRGEEQASARMKAREEYKQEYIELEKDIANLQKQIDDGAIEPRFLEEAQNDLARLVRERKEGLPAYWQREGAFAKDYIRSNPDKADFVKKFSKKTEDEQYEEILAAGSTNTDLGSLLYFITTQKKSANKFLSKIDDYAAEAARKAPEITAIPTNWGSLPATIFNQLDEFKKVVGAYSYRVRPEGKISFNASAEMDTLYQSLRNVLEDEKLFGEAAKAQAAVNAPFHRLLKNAGRFQKRFLIKDGDVLRPNPSKVSTFIRRADEFDERASLDKEVFEDTIKSFQDFIDAAKGSYGDDFAGFAANTGEINKQLANFGELLAAQKELRHLSQANDSSMSLLAGGAAYAIGGIPGAVVAAAANDIIRPGNAIRRRMVIHNMKSMMTKRIDKSVSRVTNRIVKNQAGGPQRASKVPPILALIGVKSSGNENEDVAAEIQAISRLSEPTSLTARIERNTVDIEDAPMLRQEIASNTVKQINMLQRAAAKAGIVETDPLTGQTRIIMSDSGKAEYLETRDTLADPIGKVTQALEQGTASRNMGRVFAEAYPILFQEYMDKLLGEIRDQTEIQGTALSFADTMQISRFSGMPLSPALQPGFIGAMQNVMKATEQARRPQRRVASLKESANRAILPVEQAMT